MKKFATRFGLALVILILALAAVKCATDARYFSEYDPSLPFNAVEGEHKVVNDTMEAFGQSRPRHYERFVVSFETRPGEMAPTLITMPPDPPGKLPLIIFVHGMGQEKEFLDDITGPFNNAGFAMACFDQHSQGERKLHGNYLQEAIAFRQRPWRTVNDVRRFIDFVQTRPEFDPERIYLVGASFGAITGCSAISFDKRIKAGVLVVGGGNVPLMLKAPFIKEHTPAPLYLIAKPIVSCIMAPADPINYASGTSPTPILFLNGNEDSLVTPAAGKALFDAAGEPKEIRWYPIEHPGLRDEDGPYILNMLDDALAWLTEQDKAVTGQTAPANPS